MREKSGQLVWDQLIPWIIGIGVLVLVLILYTILTGKGIGVINYLKKILGFG